jgi:hypothetical protein
MTRQLKLGWQHLYIAFFGGVRAEPVLRCHQHPDKAGNGLELAQSACRRWCFAIRDDDG